MSSHDFYNCDNVEQMITYMIKYMTTKVTCGLYVQAQPLNLPIQPKLTTYLTNLIQANLLPYKVDLITYVVYFSLAT